MSTEHDELQFLPFHAINEFMRPDFRLLVIRETLSVLQSLSEDTSSTVNRLIHKQVKIPGFRNSEKAPSVVKVIPTGKIFEKSSDMVAAILMAWSESKDTLRQQVLDLLTGRGWKTFPDEIKSIADISIPKTANDWAILPAHVNRAKLPGFIIFWPKGEDFETLYDHFNKLYPDSSASMDQVSLMVVWLTLRLPYNITEDETESTSEIDNTSQSEAE